MHGKKAPVLVPIAQPAKSDLRLDQNPPPVRGIFARLARMYCRMTSSPAYVLQRRQVGIHAYVGPNGSGKTACMVRDTEPALDGIRWRCYVEDHKHNDPQYDDRGDFIGYGPNAQHEGYVRILSTVRLYDPDTGQLHPRYEKFDDWSQLDGLEHAELLMDEITGVAHSREGNALPHDIMNRLQQLRKGEVLIRWSAPAWARAEKLIREVTIAITVCQGGTPERRSASLWKQNRRFVYRTYNTLDFDEWTTGRAERLRPDVTEHFWGPGSRAFRLYNTLQAVTRIGHANDSGVCVACGGTRRRSECSCDDYQRRRQMARRAS